LTEKTQVKSGESLGIAMLSFCGAKWTKTCQIPTGWFSQNVSSTDTADNIGGEIQSNQREESDPHDVQPQL
jgi:hypothetical protein